MATKTPRERCRGSTAPAALSAAPFRTDGAVRRVINSRTRTDKKHRAHGEHAQTATELEQHRTAVGGSEHRRTHRGGNRRIVKQITERKRANERQRGSAGRSHRAIDEGGRGVGTQKRMRCVSSDTSREGAMVYRSRQQVLMAWVGGRRRRRARHRGNDRSTNRIATCNEQGRQRKRCTRCGGGRPTISSRRLCRRP